MNNLWLGFTLILLTSCGGSSSSDNSAKTTLNIPANTLSMGNPSASSGIFTAQLQPLFAPKTNTEFSWYQLFSVVSVYAEELTARLFQGVALPNKETFSQITADVFNKNHEQEMNLFRRKDFRGYNTWLQDGGISAGDDNDKYISPAHLAYGLLWNLWIDELDLRHKIYQAGPVASTETVDVFAASYTFLNNKYSIGWKQKAASISLHSTFEQDDANGREEELINAVISTNTLVMDKIKFLTSTTTTIKPYRVAIKAIKSKKSDSEDNVIDLVARIYRGNWSANIATQKILSQASKTYRHIILKVRVENTINNAIMRVDYAQCPDVTCTFSASSAIIGAAQYGFPKERNPSTGLAIISSQTITLSSSTLALSEI